MSELDASSLESTQQPTKTENSFKKDYGTQTEMAKHPNIFMAHISQKVSRNILQWSMQTGRTPKIHINTK